MNRKLKQAMDVADFWAGLEIDGEFSATQTQSLLHFRDGDGYTVFTNEPQEKNPIPYMVVVPDDGAPEKWSAQQKEIILHNEIVLFKVRMIFRELEEKKIRLDKKNRQRFREYMGRL